MKVRDYPFLDIFIPDFNFSFDASNMLKAGPEFRLHRVPVNIFYELFMGFGTFKALSVTMESTSYINHSSI